MPYIIPKRRGPIYNYSSGYDGGPSQLDPPEDPVCFIDVQQIVDPGDLNYAITKLITHYLEDQGHRYASFNAVIGVLECAKLELYRRMVAPYEDEKKEENGDVYQLSEVQQPEIESGS